MGTAVVTALLYLSMARGFLTFLSNIVRTDGWICSTLDAHKELHILWENVGVVRDGALLWSLHEHSHHHNADARLA